MSNYQNTIYPKIQGIVTLRTSKPKNQDENLIKITRGSKKSLNLTSRNSSKREFGKIIPSIVNENTNITSIKVNENKENVSKKILVEQKNVNNLYFSLK